MKTFTLAWTTLILAVLSGWAQNSSSANPPADTAYAVVETGANHRVWQRTTYETKPDGTVVPHIYKYTELASGLCHQNVSGQWVESQEIIEPYASGAIARQGQYQVIFGNNINSAGAVDQQTTDGQRLRSSILGLAYYDAASGQSVMIAQIQNSQGELISANQVLYPNAFTGVNADVRYTYKKGTFEQDVILREQPPTPESVGLSSGSTEIEVLTEFIDPPSVRVEEHQFQDNDLPDDDIFWGATRIGHGKAFDLGESVPRMPPIKVRRQFMNVQGRSILIEGVPLRKIQSYLSTLPLQSSLQTKHPMRVANTRTLPKTPVAQTEAHPIKMAKNPPSSQGLVLDYVGIMGNETNYTFKGDTTYYVSSEYDLMGVTTIEGGTVIKMGGVAGGLDVGGGELDIDPDGTVVCETGPYRPGLFTSFNDNSVGQPVSGSSGSPTAEDVYCFSEIDATNVTLSYLRFNYCIYTIYQPGDPAMIQIWDSQFLNIDWAVYGYNVGLHNVLIANSSYYYDAAVFVEGPSFVGENVTATGYAFMEADLSGAAINLTNCLITSPHFYRYSASPLYYYTNTSVWLPSPASPVFQVIGGGSYYLTNNSPYHNAGTTNITPALLADLAGKTTWPPVVYSNVTFSIATNFSAQALRDNAGNPDLGYHYDPLDFVFGGVTANSNLTFTADTAVGWYNGGSGEGYGIALNGSAQATFAGTATAPCVWARNDMVQEGGNGNWTAQSYLGGFIGLGGNYLPATAPTVNFDFTHCYARNFEGLWFRDYGDGTLFVANANNSEFYSGGAGGYLNYLNFTNCLAVRAALGPGCDCSPKVTMRNCTFYGGSLGADRESGATWPLVVENCAFAGVNFSSLNDTSGGNTNITWVNYNSFLTTDSLPAGQGTHYITVTGYNWQTSWFGNYYLPTNSTLIRAGSTTANLVGLYHFTTQTNQVPEGDSVVDIGYHYVATDAYGNPLDTNGDGIPDYLEDANGDGIYDAGDLANWLINPFNGLSSSSGLSVFTPLK